MDFNGNQYAEALKGISYRDWKMLKRGIDIFFAKKISEYSNKLELTDSEELREIIHLQFE